MKASFEFFIFAASFVLSQTAKSFESNQIHRLTVTSSYGGANNGGKGGICDPGVKQFSGYFEFSNNSKKYFFWFFESRHLPNTDPTFMWLNGGPGCSSIMGLFFENGPCSVQDDLKTKMNPYSWTSKANGMWVDQPPGVGFSQGKSDSGEAEVADDMYHFLLKFFEAFPEYNRDFFIFGESYGGHYVSAISNFIYKENLKRLSKDRVDLKGIAIGNGLTNTEEQFAWYPLMGYNSTTAPSVFSKQQYERMLASVPKCQKLIRDCNNFDRNCHTAYNFCNEELVGPYEKTGLNNYDMREQCKVPPSCYDFSRISAYLNQYHVQKSLNVSTPWSNCNDTVYVSFIKDYMHNFHQLLPEVIEGGVRTLIYAGDVDFICNWIGNKEWCLKLEWKGQKDFLEADDQEYFVGDEPAGKLRGVFKGESMQFAFLQVYKAGHMVPTNQPQISLQMMNDFMANELHHNVAGSRRVESNTGLQMQ